MGTVWKSRYAQRNQRMGQSIIRELLKLTMQHDIISFAGGLPAPELFPVERCAEAASRILGTQGDLALQYGPSEGYPPLRQFICEQMARYGIHADIDNILITNGSQQALDLVGKLLINPGDRVLVEEPTYLGALQAWNGYMAEYVTVPLAQEDDWIAQLETSLRVGPKLMYLLPNFQNPGGTTLSLAQRNALVRLSNKCGVPIIEDDPYGALRFEGEHLCPLLTLDAQLQKSNGLNARSFDEGNVIFLGTFSKTLAPGLRLGWAVAPVEVIEQLVLGKQGADLHTGSFSQMLAFEVAKDGFLEEHVRLIRRVYRERRDVMLDGLQRHFPLECTWTHPEGGLFLWVKTPESIDTTELLKVAVEHKVAYVPGVAFYPNPLMGRNTMRLNFSNARPAQLDEGIRRLGGLLKEAMNLRALK